MRRPGPGASRLLLIEAFAVGVLLLGVLRWDDDDGASGKENAPPAAAVREEPAHCG